MKYIKQEIENFISINITEDFNEWDELTTYTYENESSLTNASVVRVGGSYYRSLTTNNIGNNPETDDGVYWSYWSPSNGYAMLDNKSLSKTILDDGNNLVVEFDRGSIDTISLGYFQASKIIIQHYDNSDNEITEVKQEHVYDVNDDVYDLWDYIYADYSYDVDRNIIYNIAPVGTKIKITFEPSLGSVECGFLIGGQSNDMGCTVDEVSFSFTSYSTVETDAFGNLTILRRNVQDAIDFETLVDKANIMSVKRNVKSIYDEIVLFIVDESEDSDFENMTTLGKIQDVNIVGSLSDKNIITWAIIESI
jgi:hypothetical protein